ncbi:serine/threonine-protein kinase [Arthrobacter sp. HLT1-21]
MNSRDANPGSGAEGASGAEVMSRGVSAGLILGGRYRLGTPIGQGGMASVYRAHDEVLHREVAVKLFRAGATEADEIDRQQGEARVLAGLSHHNLVTVFDIGTETAMLHPQTYLVMELVHGEDLHRAKYNASLTADETAAMGAGVADALAYIHGRDIVHRDVKPANILLGRRGDAQRARNPKLTDFGIARLVDSARLTATGQSVGTAAYLSPEQAEGHSVTPASDIYSLGLVLLECLTGDTAFPGPAAASAAARLYRGPQIPAALGNGWTSLLHAMTARDPLDRPSAAHIASALRSVPGSGSPQAIDNVDPKTPDPETISTMGGTSALRQGFALQDGQSTSAIPAANRTGKLPSHSLITGQNNDPAQPGRTQGLPRQRRKPRAAQWALIALILTVALLVMALMVVPNLNIGSGPTPVPVDYPATPGELGDLLQELQDSVAP